jgi:outer membrane protein assembly factor BamB
MIVEHEGRAQVVLTGANFARAYDLESGDEVWKVSGLTRGPVPAPVPGTGMVFLASGTNGQAFKAMRLGGSGDLTGTDFEAWTLAKSVSYNPTPLLWGDELYMLKDVMSGNTFVSMFDAGTGAPSYQDSRLPQAWTIKASPVGAAGRIYLSSEEGDVIVLARGPVLEVLAVNEMDEQILATPAIAGPDLFLRTRGHLWRIARP